MAAKEKRPLEPWQRLDVLVLAGSRSSGKKATYKRMTQAQVAAVVESAEQRPCGLSDFKPRNG